METVTISKYVSKLFEVYIWFNFILLFALYLFFEMKHVEIQFQHVFMSFHTEIINFIAKVLFEHKYYMTNDDAVHVQ